MQRVPMSVMVPLRWKLIGLVAVIGAVRDGCGAPSKEARGNPPTISRAPGDPVSGGVCD